jgi:hypothetical protein
VTAAGEYDRIDATEPRLCIVLEREGVDHHDPVLGAHGVGGADEVDPLVVDRPAPDAGDDLLDGCGDRLGLAHPPIIAPAR